MVEQWARRWWWCLMVVVVVVAALASGVGAARTQNCEMTSSRTPGKMDVYCNCMQRLSKVEVGVARLTINQTGCARAGLQLSWPELEAEVAPDKLVLAGARVYFTEGRTTDTWQPSITAIHFINCSFEEVPSHAFQGLQMLEEVRLIGGAVGVVRAGAFSGLPHLRVVEAVNASLGVLEGGAWASLPALKDLALVRCSIGEVQTLAVNLTRDSPAGEDKEACGPAQDSDSSRVLEVLSGRNLTPDAANLTLPDFGTQMLLFKNSIEVLAPRALAGDAFGFLIMGGNAVGSVADSALDLALHNRCEISAALLVGNTIAGLEDGALSGLHGWREAPRRTFLALTNNTFSSVAPRAFTLHQDIHVFSARQNRFRCHCDALQWAATGAEATKRPDLQEELLAEGMCQDDSSLAAFIATCTHGPTFPSPSIVPPPPPHTTTHHSFTSPSPSPAPSPSPSPSPFPSLSPSPSQPPFPTPSPSPIPSHSTTLTPSHDSSTSPSDAPFPSGASGLALAPATFLTLLVAGALR